MALAPSSSTMSITLAKDLQQAATIRGDDDDDVDDVDVVYDGCVFAEEGDGLFIEIENIGRNSRRIKSKILIDATLDTVWSILTDYEKLSDFLPGLAISKLVEKKDKFARLYQIGQQNLPFGVKFKAKGVVDCYEKDLETSPFKKKRDIEFKMIEGDFQTFEGKWSIEQCNKRCDENDSSADRDFQTTLSYLVDVKPKMWLPVRLVEGRLTNEIKTNLSCIREEAQMYTKAFSCLLLIFAAIHSAYASDADNLQDLCVADSSAGIKVNGFACKPDSSVTPDDFYFNGLATPGYINNSFGAVVTGANVQKIPGLNTLGVSLARIDFAPGGLNPPHTHPRATEIMYVLEGDLEAGFITTANKLLLKNVKKGEIYVFPKGLVHFQRNIGEKPAAVISASNSQLPGTQSIGLSLFAATPEVPDNVLSRAFQMGTKQIDKLKTKFAPKKT
ncbi:hypothetical protein ACFE04_017412 [Oxalis oulophora]